MSYFKKVFKPVTAERVDVIAELLLRLVGESVQSKLVRAVLVGAITAGSQYVKDDAAAPPSPPVAPVSAQAVPTSK